MDILLPGETWQRVSAGHRQTDGLAINDSGEVFFSDVERGCICRVDLDGKVSVFADDTQGACSLMFADDGNLYACQTVTDRIVTYDRSGEERVIVEDIPSHDLVMLQGKGYATDPTNQRIWHFTIDGQKQVVSEGIAFPYGVTTIADNAFLLVSDRQGRFTYSFVMNQDGALGNQQRMDTSIVLMIVEMSGLPG